MKKPATWQFEITSWVDLGKNALPQYGIKARHPEKYDGKWHNLSHNRKLLLFDDPFEAQRELKATRARFRKFEKAQEVPA